MSFFGNSSGKKNKDKYKQLTLAIRQTVLERSKYRCQECSVKLSGTKEPHFIHINGSKKDNRPENLKPICPDCFGGKTPKENSNPNTMLSSLKKIFSKS